METARLVTEIISLDTCGYSGNYRRATTQKAIIFLMIRW